ncbi:antitermination protein Q [Lelliottia wanjuensis]|uniref:antitermination protein Q n=1 Tax=Lelliottia wanjuensis TaxID=3050585 RepID=UPI00254EA50F|nr:antitermination protein [Lelliottia sp. V86_10]MDK9585430.1 antitermination protein [Lelliottia sp. V86_10]
MKLEAIVKYFSPKSMTPGAVPCGMTADTLTITDVMASLGMAAAQSAIGIELYLAKAGVLPPDSITNYIEQLATERSKKNRALQKMGTQSRRAFLRTLAEYVFRDYSLSAASTAKCDCCSGTGFIDAEVFTMKAWRVRDTWLPQEQDREQIRVICKPCNGKGAIKNECRCRGRGEVLDKEKTDLQGVPVYSQCKRCAGRGYPRLKEAEIYAALGIPKSTWSRTYKLFFDRLVEHCHMEESSAERSLCKVTH